MSALQQISQMFASFWEIFTLPHPLLGISFGSIIIGVFIVSLSVRFLLFFLFNGDGEKGRDSKRQSKEAKKKK